jgi:plasmid stabilization system protein ParE
LATVRLTRQARQDLNEITDYYEKVAGTLVARRNQRTIKNDLLKIATNYFLGNVDPIVPTLLYWYTLDTNYKVYFRRYRLTSIQVYRIYSSSRDQLTPDQIETE